MPIQTLLDLSTAHVTLEDSKLLGKYPASDRPYGMALIAYPYEYGWTVSTSQMNNPDAGAREDFIEHVRREGFSEGFVKLLEHAAEQGVAMIRLDSSGDPEPGLDYYDWEQGNGDVAVDPDSMIATEEEILSGPRR